tara:strand:- start:11444 stop:11671 length:228 start_codon:yes stop_codon:yes gene_type:complete
VLAVALTLELDTTIHIAVALTLELDPTIHVNEDRTMLITWVGKKEECQKLETTITITSITSMTTLTTTESECKFN